MLPLREQLDNILYLLPRFILITIFAACMLITVGISFDRSEPYLRPYQQRQLHVRKIARHIYLGNCPLRGELFGLRANLGIGVLVSVLDPALPDEQCLLDVTRQKAASLGLEYASFPMRSGSDATPANRESLRQLVAFVRSHKDRNIFIFSTNLDERTSEVQRALREEGIAPHGL